MLRRVVVRYAYVFPFIQLLVFLPLQWQRTDARRDLTVYYRVAGQVDAGGTLYDPRPPAGPHQPAPIYYLYPPFFAAAVALLPAMGFLTFARVWLLLTLVAYWAFAACLSRIATNRVSLRGTLVAGALLFLIPGTRHALELGQADVMTWTLIGAALAWPALTGAGFMAVALIKVFTVWPLLAACLRPGRVRVVVSAAAVAVAATILAVVMLGADRFVAESLVWLREVLPTLRQGQFMRPDDTITVAGIELSAEWVPYNLSLTMLPLKIAALLGWEWSGAELPAAAQAYLTICAVGAPLATAWFARHRSASVHLALTLAAALLFAPILRPTYLPALAPLVALWWRGRNEPA